MAKQAGILPLIGTIGGINFYYRKGVPTARIAGGGFNKAAIKHSPTMKRVRELNTEFAACSKTNKFFKMAIKPMLDGYTDGSLHARLMRLFMQIRDCDTESEHGKRRVWKGMETTLGKSLLTGFTFTSKRTRLFPGTYRFDWDALGFVVSSFSVSIVGFPAHADFMSVTLGVVRFDFETMVFSTINTETLKINRDFALTTFSMECPNIPVGSGSILVLARVAFYETIGGIDNLLSGEGGFGFEVLSVSD